MKTIAFVLIPLAFQFAHAVQPPLKKDHFPTPQFTHESKEKVTCWLNEKSSFEGSDYKSTGNFEDFTLRK